MEMEPTYHLEGIIRTKEDLEDFEGPLNLILMLLSKNKIEIRDIQISEILEQYLAYLEQMKAMDLELASEFVRMASHLLYIKTKMLLESDEEGASEMELLIASLEQLKAKDVYASIKEACPALSSVSEYGRLYCCKQPEPLPGVKEYRYQHEGWELLKALGDVFRRGRTAADEAEEQTLAERRRRLVPKRIIYSVRDKSREILHRLGLNGRQSLRALYSESRSRSEVVATFVSILELCSHGHTKLTRENDEIIVSFLGGDADEIAASSSE